MKQTVTLLIVLCILPLFATYHKISEYDTQGNANSIQVIGNLAYITDSVQGIMVLDISNPEEPQLLSSYPTPGEAKSLSIIGNRAYLADGSNGLRIYDISDPTHTVYLGGDFYLDAMDVAVVDSLAFVTCDGVNLQIVNISNPEAPQELGYFQCSESDYGLSIDVSDNIAYIADYNYGLHIVNISDPNNPQLLHSYETPYPAYCVQVVGNIAYLTDRGSGLMILDVSNPLNPVLIGSMETP
ncbi:MAG TPA: hypothetical protein PKK33_08880, partial [Candidatus Cloacimonadota bacterium]|nr:hypothetical protein [Candidatus Cloacimonadota bacterium]